jgi:hypothetical protein
MVPDEEGGEGATHPSSEDSSPTATPVDAVQTPHISSIATPVPTQRAEAKPRRGRSRIPASHRARPYSISLTPVDLQLAKAACKARGINGLTRLFRILLEENTKGAIRELHQHYQAREADLARIIRQQAAELERLRKPGASSSPPNSEEGV